MVACPYAARVFNWKKPEVQDQHKGKDYSPETSVPPVGGTVGKCDFCPDMAREGKVPHCVSACPMGVIYFGDANEDAVTNGIETLRLSELVVDKAAYKYLEFFGTEPNVLYLPPVNRQFPFNEEEQES